MIKQRLLSEHTGLRISAIALETGRLGTSKDRPVDLVEARATFHAFADAGGTFLDTSSAYQGGHAEEMVGAFLAERGRDAFVVSSKYGRTPLPSPAAAALGNSRRVMIAEVEGSLRRLMTERIELYFPHFDDGVTPIEEILHGLDALVRAKKIMHVGLSNFPAWRVAPAATLARERRLAGVVALQVQYNLLERGIEREHLPLARACGMAVMAFSPLGGGQLTKLAAHVEGAPPPASPLTPLESALLAVAAEVGASPGEVAIAWLCATDVIPVLGPRTREQLLQNLRGAELSLSEAQLRSLNDASHIALGYPYDLLAQQWASLGLNDLGAGAVF